MHDIDLEALLVTVRKTDRRREYIFGHLVLLSISIGAVLVGVSSLIIPDSLTQGALGQALPGETERLWALVYALAGALTVYGVVRTNSKPEMFGCMLLAACFGTYGYAILAENGWVPGAIVAGLLFTLAVGFMARSYVLRFEPGSEPWMRRSSS